MIFINSMPKAYLSGKGGTYGAIKKVPAAEAERTFVSERQHSVTFVFLSAFLSLSFSAQ